MKKIQSWDLSTNDVDLFHDHVNEKGMNMIITALFIVGEMAGGGVVALPDAIKNTSWAGIFLIAFLALVTAYTGAQLGWCWTMLQRTWPQYKQHCRKPYPAMGYHAVGPWMKHLVSLCIDLTLFGAGVVFTILAAGNIENLLKLWFNYEIKLCIMILIVAALLLPLTYFGTPMDFWPISIIASLCTTIAIVAMIVGIIQDKSRVTEVVYSEPTFISFSLAFATITFSYGGHSAFPTLQHDMKTPSQFAKSITIAYIGIVMLYLPISALSYGVYGDQVQPNIINNLSNVPWCNSVVSLLITGHVMFSFIIVLNPLNQEIEEIMRVPREFGWQRVLSRTFTVLAIVIVAETVPKFGVVLNLIGGTTTTALTFIFPGIFYLLLKKKTGKELYLRKVQSYSMVSTIDKIPFTNDVPKINEYEITKLELIINFSIIVIGVCGGIASTYGAVKTLVYPSEGGIFTVPCFINSTAVG